MKKKKQYKTFNKRKEETKSIFVIFLFLFLIENRTEKMLQQFVNNFNNTLDIVIFPARKKGSLVALIQFNTKAALLSFSTRFFSTFILLFKLFSISNSIFIRLKSLNVCIGKPKSLSFAVAAVVLCSFDCHPVKWLAKFAMQGRLLPEKQFFKVLAIII